MQGSVVLIGVMMADFVLLSKAYLFLMAMCGLGLISKMVMSIRAGDWAAVTDNKRR
jgi:hypothetical protein